MIKTYKHKDTKVTKKVHKSSQSIFYLCVSVSLWFLMNLSSAYALTLHGFVEGAYGARFNNDITKKDDYNLAEARLQLKGSYLSKIMEEWQPEFVFKGDLLHDHYDETTQGILREAYLFITPRDNLDIKVGRQILTWGTGDFLFINDLFPKDYVSFFNGRDDEYLKLPSDALKASLFLKKWNIDMVIIPYFEPNNSLTGKRHSFYNGLAGKIVGENSGVDYREPAHTVENMEKTFRFYRNIGSYETAIYLFDGFYKQPLGVKDPASMKFFYPELNVYGFSIRGPFAGGIGNLEVGYYDSREDSSGDDPQIENSGIKYLAGYEKDMGKDFKVSIQYQIEQMLDYDEYRDGLSAGEPEADELRHLTTLRLTQLAMNQNLTLSLFTFYSPSDEDYHLRPNVSYKFSDHLSATVGGNIFGGEDDHTFFGQLRRNDNVYLRVRYSF